MLRHEDLYSLEQYARERPAFRAKVMAHKKTRRVELGKHASLHFEDALTMNARMGAKPWLAHTQCHYANALLFRGLQADIARCNVLLDEALATAQALGMHALSSRIQTMKRAATDHTM